MAISAIRVSSRCVALSLIVCSLCVVRYDHNTIVVTLPQWFRARILVNPSTREIGGYTKAVSNLVGNDIHASMWGYSPEKAAVGTASTSSRPCHTIERHSPTGQLFAGQARPE